MRISIKHSIISLAALITLTISIYYPSLNGGFHHDDRPNLVFNKTVQIDTLSVESIKKASTSSSAGRLKRPISMGSFALNYYFFGDDPFSFKLTNVILHILTAILVFFVIYHIKLAINQKDTRSAYWFAVITTLIWVAHPLHVSTVAYIVQRMAILSTLFTLLAILFYIIGRKKIIKNKTSGYIFFILSLLSTILGIYSKENAVLVPVFIMLIEAIIFYPKSKSISYKKAFKFASLAAALIAVLVTLLFFNQINIYLTEWYYRSREFTLSERLYTQSRIIIYYIKWLAFPNIQELGLFHDDIQLSKSLTSPITTLFSIIAIISLAIFAVVIKNKHPIITLGIGWFFIGHLLESTIIPLELVYEHRNYLPSIGLIFTTIYIINIAVLKIKKSSQYPLYFALLLVSILSFVTFIRTNQWSDPINFAYFEAMHHPKSLRASHTLGLEYKGMAEMGYLEYKEDAYKYLEKASQLGEKRLYSEVALLKLAKTLNEPAKPSWIDSMTKKLSDPALRIDDIMILKEITLCKEGECLLPKDASLLLYDAVESNPRLTLRKRLYSRYLSIRANFILQRGGNIDEANTYYKHAISSDPKYIQNYVDYIHLLLAIEKPTEASIYMKKAKENNKIYENIPLLNELSETIEQASQGNNPP